MALNVRPEILDLIAALASTFGREADEALFLGYSMALDDIEVDELERGVRRAMRECKFIPVPVELRELSGQLPPAARALLAWDALQIAVRKHGYYTSVRFDDPVLTAAVKSLGGWERLSVRFEEDELKWLQKDFERVYTTKLSVGVVHDPETYLPGHFERQNDLNGYEPKEPVLIETGFVPKREAIVDHREPRMIAKPTTDAEAPQP